MTKLLILSVSVGRAHARVAEAIEATARAMPEAPQVEHLDGMAHVAAGFGKVYEEGCAQLASRPSGPWTAGVDDADGLVNAGSAPRLRRSLASLGGGGLVRAVREARPDAIVCTHFMPAELLTRERHRERVACPVWLQVTDYDLHDLWPVPGLAGYFVATDEAAHRLRARGLPASRIHVTGIPVMPAFTNPQSTALDRAACRQQCGLGSVAPVVLITAGSHGIAESTTMAEGLLGLPGDLQVIVVAGRNELLKSALDSLARHHHGRLGVVGYTDDMPTLMAAADLVITRPGGSTVSECLALGRPMLLVAPASGHEEHNADYLVEQGAAWLAFDGVGLGYKVMRLTSEPMQLAAMAAHSRRLGQPGAAQALLERVLRGG